METLTNEMELLPIYWWLVRGRRHKRASQVRITAGSAVGVPLWRSVRDLKPEAGE
jgi:hypothetical protein